MPKRQRREGGEQHREIADLTSFFERRGEEEAKPQPYLREDIEAAILSFVRSRGTVTRSELYEWSKKRGIKPADFYRCLTSLVSKGVIERKFDTQREEYVFSLAPRK